LSHRTPVSGLHHLAFGDREVVRLMVFAAY
jgi:hypothetical protein